MNEYQMSVENMRREMGEKCLCKGSGWVSNAHFDYWEECPFHRGLPHPEYDDYIEGDGGNEPDDWGVDCGVQTAQQDGIPF